MSSFGSSYVYGLTFSSFGVGPRGLTGSTGSIGPTGAMGPSRRGNTGNTGPNLVNISKVEDSFLKYDFSDSSTEFSNDPIIGHPGYVKVRIDGATVGAFNLLRTVESNVTDSDGAFPVDILTFRGLSTATPDYIKIRYSGDNRSLIDISYDLINVGYIGISGGTLGNILQNLPGQFQAGITSTKYNEDQNSTLIQHRNIQEGLNIAKPTIIGTNIAYWKIDPSEATVFYISPHGISLAESTQVNGLIFFIKRPQYGNLSKGISLHFPNNFNPYNNKIYYAVYDDDTKITSGITFSSYFGQNFDFEAVAWQNDSYFCPAANKFNVLNLISLGGRYLGIPAQYDENSTNITNIKTTINETCYPFYATNEPINSNTLGNGICCPSSCGESATEVPQGQCTGYFIPTVGLGSSSLCSRIGSCCIFKDEIYNHSEKTYCQCMQSGLNATKVIWHPFEGLKSSLSSFDCSSLLVGQSYGACCDGNGDCNQNITEIDCRNINYFFQGIGVLCGNVCAGGSGGCCDSGLTCSNGITASDCLGSNKTYLGDKKYCQSFNCSPDSIPCVQTIPGISELKQGDEYAGGIVAGLFTIGENSDINVYGHDIFGQHDATRLQTLHNVGVLTDSYKQKTFSRKYKSVFNYLGYGFDSLSGNLSEQNESFIIIVAKNDIEINNNKQFLWSKKQNMWGPLYDSISQQYDIREADFWASFPIEGNIFPPTPPTTQNFTQLSNRTRTLFNFREDNDAMEWLYSKISGPSGRSINGKWSRNYGLENTARLIGSKFIYDEELQPGYQPDTGINGNTIVDAIIQYNINNPPTSERESSWFIPSHDEMGYLSNLCQIQTDFNLNSSLILSGNTPIDGDYWSSTGTFDLSNPLEGLDTLSSPSPTKAWYFSINSEQPYNNTYNYSISESRQNTYKVRPIKIIRCDGRFSTFGQNNYKVWRMRLT